MVPLRRLAHEVKGLVLVAVIVLPADAHEREVVEGLGAALTCRALEEPCRHRIAFTDAEAVLVEHGKVVHRVGAPEPHGLLVELAGLRVALLDAEPIGVEDSEIVHRLIVPLLRGELVVLGHGEAVPVNLAEAEGGLRDAPPLGGEEELLRGHLPVPGKPQERHAAEVEEGLP